MLKNNRNKINWDNLSDNPNPLAIKLLEENPKKIDWYYLSLNECEEAIELLKKKS